MNIAAIAAVVAVVWFGQAAALSQLMARRGFHPLPWVAVSLLLGPAVWPLAVIDLASGPPGPDVLRRGRSGDGPQTILVAFDRDELSEETALQLHGLLPRCGRLVLARVIKAGGPAAIPAEARRFLEGAASRIRADDAELQLRYGTFEKVLAEIRREGDFGLVVRADQPNELFDGDGSRQEMGSERDVAAA